MTIIKGRDRDLGGFSVKRVLPAIGKKMVGPYIFFDHMGPALLGPGHNMDVRPHPHINLSTVTYLFEGVIEHRDSLGSDQLIEPGAINWMTAGKGIVHSERTPNELRNSPMAVDGIQLWVALPEAKEEMEPQFSHHPKESLPEFIQDGVRVRLLLGEAFGRKSPVPIHSRMIYAEIELKAGQTFHLPADGQELAAYIAKGEAEAEGEVIERFSMFIAEGDLKLRAKSDARIMILGGETLGPRFIDWNFVTSEKARLEEAKAEWRKGPRPENERFFPIPGDAEEFTPLPN